MALVEAGGADALSMRKLAAELGVATTTIYWHAGNRDELILAVVARVAEQTEPAEVTGDDLDGTEMALSDTRGTVTVINVWGSWCAPCVAEAPELQKVWSDLELEDAPVQFIGIDFREEAARGAAFAKKAGITYPSLSDESGVLILEPQGKAPTVPTTLVLDTLGRIAARVNGPVSASTLRGLVDDVLAEP